MLEVLADRVVARRDQLRSGCREAEMPTSECPLSITIVGNPVMTSVRCRQ